MSPSSGKFVVNRWRADRANTTRRDEAGDASVNARALWRDVYLTEPRVLRRPAVGSFAFFKLVKP